jgi:hypothetical protein
MHTYGVTWYLPKKQCLANKKHKSNFFFPNPFSYQVFMFQLVLTGFKIFVGASQLTLCTVALFLCVCLFVRSFVPALLDGKHYAWLGYAALHSREPRSFWRGTYTAILRNWKFNPPLETVGPHPRCLCPILLVRLLHTARPGSVPQQLTAFQAAELRLLETNSQTRHFISLMCICRLIMLLRAPLREVKVKGRWLGSKCELHVGMMQLIHSQHIGQVGVLAAVLLKMRSCVVGLVDPGVSKGLWYLRNVRNC